MVPNATENVTFAINNQLSNQVQRLVRERPSTYENLYQIYGPPRNVGRQYTNGRIDHFQNPIVSSILCPPGYQTMPSPTKHVVVGTAAMQPPLQQYVNVPVPVSMVEPTNGQRMLLTNAVQTNSVAWPTGGRQVALVPSWPQAAAPHSLIVDSTPYLNVENMYPKHLNLSRHEAKKESPIHHLVVPRHEKKETNQLSPVKKRVKESTPPHQQRYNKAHVSPQYHHNSHHNSFYSSNLNHVQQQNASTSTHQNINFNDGHHHNNSHMHNNSGGSIQNTSTNSYPSTSHSSNHNNGHNSSSSLNHSYNNLKTNQQTITITDTPSPAAVITISDSEDESPEVQQTPSSSASVKSNRTQNSTTSSAVASTSCRSNIINNSSSSSINSNIINNNSGSHHHTGVINSASSHSLNSNSSNNGSSSNRQRKNVISCFTVGDSDGEDRRSPRQQQQQQQQNQQPQQQQQQQATANIKFEPHVGQSQKKRLLAMAQNECLLSSSSSSSNQLHVPKQEPNEFAYEYPTPYDKRASWAPPAHHKRESVSYLTTQPAPPPMAHAKNNTAASWGAPIYRQQHQSNTPLGGSPGSVLQHDIYAQGDMYRRPTVFVSQAPYQNYDRVVVPPPAHNGSSRQVSNL